MIDLASIRLMLNRIAPRETFQTPSYHSNITRRFLSSSWPGFGCSFQFQPTAIRVRNLQNIISHSGFVAEPPSAPLHIGHRFEGRDFDRSALNKERASWERSDQFRGAATASI
jgi:hypothetical protein